MIKGQVISGQYGNILVRQKSNTDLEIGELLIAGEKDKILLQVCDLLYGSQISKSNLELISGLKMEEDDSLELMDAELRNYNLAVLKNLINIKDNKATACKNLPKFFDSVREVSKEDLMFLSKPEMPLCIGKLRSGSKVLDVDIYLEGNKALTEHMLIPAATGRGKSNLTSCILWNSIDKEYCGILVLDPHDEYYGRNKLGLKDHPENKKVVYYSPNPPVGAKTLKINIANIRPSHFNGAVFWSDAQKEALAAYYKKYKTDWIKAILLEQNIENFQEGTINVLKRRLSSLLNLHTRDNEVYSEGVFDLYSGKTTINDICNELEESKTVIIDTSSFAGSVEILIGTLATSEIFNRYKKYKADGTLDKKPVISIVLEEAPRVLGKEVLGNGNVFSTIAREGRKFKVGLIAITQLPSLIPREILANMNTKIILGIEMAPERQAIIESSAQDLSADNRNIASLDKGEAIITSNFVKFATPVKIPLFEDLVNEAKMQKEKYKKVFSGIEDE